MENTLVFSFAVMIFFNLFAPFECSDWRNSCTEFPNNPKFLMEFLKLKQQMRGLFAVATQLNTLQSALLHLNAAV
jgi:hypothetical protein